MNLLRRQAIAVMAVAASSMVGIGAASADWRDQVPTFRIGILGGELEAIQLRRHACLQARTEQALGVPVELAPWPDYGGIYEGLHGGTLEAAALGAAGYAGLFLESPDLVEPLVTVKQEDGQLGYHSVLFVRADSPYQTLDDLRSKSLAFTARLSASGFLIPYHELTEQGYEPRRFFGRLAFAGSHPQAVTAVLNGDFDAGVTWSSVMGDVENGYSRGNLRRMVERGLLEMADLRILWQSELIPEGPYVVRKALPQEAKDLFRQVLLDLADRDRACFERIVGGNAIDFELITHEHYDSIVDIRRNGIPGDS
ncbi:MAG: phosphate/phosphite/phosphonate ABC transporter substrate-binding protein [Geminicoccaceae bacterium]